MLSVMQAIDRLVVKAALGVAMILLALMSCITFYQVITRFVLESPSIWSEVAARSLMIWYGWAMAERTGSQGLAGLTNPITGGIISIGLVYAAIPIGAALSVIAVIARLVEELGRHGPPPEPVIVQDI